MYHYDAYYVPMPERDIAKCLGNMHMYTQILNHMIMYHYDAYYVPIPERVTAKCSNNMHPSLCE